MISDVTKLTPEQQRAVLYWPMIAKIPIIGCNSRNKEFNNLWKDIDFSQVDWNVKLANGEYDNGNALVLGKTLPGSPYPYSFALDFDGYDAVKKFFGDWDRVLSLSDKTRVEWHQDKGRLHIVFLSDRPVTKKRIPIKDTDSAFEVRSDELLISSPSIHGSGKPWTVLGTEEIAALDEINLLRLESKIDNICQGYMSDSGKTAYIAWLENLDNWRSIGVGQGRHSALVTLGTSYYYRYTDDWRNLTDDQRRDRLWERNQQFKTPKSEDEFNLIWKWIVKTHRKTRDQQFEELNDKAAQTETNNPAEMPGCISYQINSRPDIWITGTPDNKLVEVIKKSKLNDNGLITNYYVTRKTFLACKPVRMIVHRNPISEMIKLPQKYTIQFRGSEPSGNFTLEHKTLAEIVATLKDGQTLTEYGIDNAIHAQIKAFEQRRLIEYSDDIEYTGFFIDNEGKIFSSNVEIKSEIDKSALRIALDVIEQAATKFYEGRLDLLATTIKWGVIAPFSFIIKCRGKGRYLIWMHLFGISNSGKSTTGKFALALDGNHTITKGFMKFFNDVNTSPKFADYISTTTFPKMINEVSISPYDNTKYIIGDIKTAVESLLARSKFMHSRDPSATPIPALSPCVLTGNPSLPNDSALLRRIVTRNFPNAEFHEIDSEEGKKFQSFQDNNLDKLAVIGDFRNRFIMNSPDMLEDIDKIEPLEIGKKILYAAYEYAEMKPPEWLESTLSREQLEVSIKDIKQSVVGAFQLLINNCLKNFTGTKHFEDTENEKGFIDHAFSIQERLAKVVDSSLLPYIRYQKLSKEIIIINKEIIEELYKLGVTRDQLPSLHAFADYLGIEYYKSSGVWVAKGTLSEICKNFNFVDENV